MAGNGFDGFQITPRWATNIYYNVCDKTHLALSELKLTWLSVIPQIALYRSGSIHLPEAETS